MDSYAGKRALVVDDDPIFRPMVVHVLKKLGMEVIEAEDGADAVYKTMREPFDLITMDIEMPHVNGLDAIHAIQMIDPQARIIVISGVEEEATHEAAGLLGIQHYIHKPITADIVQDAVHDMMSQSAPTIG